MTEGALSSSAVRTTLLTGIAALSIACATSRAGVSASAPVPEASAPAEAEALHFIENDYPRALAEAKTRGVPVFVDVWAPW